MSADVVKDILTYLEEKGIGTYGRLLQRQVSAETRDLGSQYVTAYISSASNVVYNEDETDILTVTIQVCGGLGEKGQSDGSALARSVYKALNLDVDKNINSTLYCGIHNTSAPYETIRGQSVIYTWNVEIVRFFGADISSSQEE